MNEEKKEEPEEKNGIGKLMLVIAVVMILVVGLGLYNYISHPFYVADELREHLDSMDNVSNDYYQGWSDCVDYYLKMETGPTNITSAGVD